MPSAKYNIPQQSITSRNPISKLLDTKTPWSGKLSFPKPLLNKPDLLLKTCRRKSDDVTRSLDYTVNKPDVVLVQTQVDVDAHNYTNVMMPRDDENITIIQVNNDVVERTLLRKDVNPNDLMASKKLQVVIENFDRILNEYKTIDERPKLQKTKSCSIIESKCILKKTASAPKTVDIPVDAPESTLAKTKSMNDLMRVNTPPKSPKLSKIPKMTGLSKAATNQSGLTPDSLGQDCLNPTSNRKPKAKVMSKSTTNLTLGKATLIKSKSTVDVSKPKRMVVTEIDEFDRSIDYSVESIKTIVTDSVSDKKPSSLARKPSDPIKAQAKTSQTSPKTDRKPSTKGETLEKSPAKLKSPSNPKLSPKTDQRAVTLRTGLRSATSLSSVRVDARSQESLMKERKLAKVEPKLKPVESKASVIRKVGKDGPTKAPVARKPVDSKNITSFVQIKRQTLTNAKTNKTIHIKIKDPIRKEESGDAARLTAMQENYTSQKRNSLLKIETKTAVDGGAGALKTPEFLEEVKKTDGKLVTDGNCSDDSGHISNEHDDEELVVKMRGKVVSSAKIKTIVDQFESNGGRCAEDGKKQIFFRPGTLAQLEAQRDTLLTGRVINLQARCRGYLARRRLQRRKLQETAVRCVQRNVRAFIAVRDWSWWRLLVRVTPLLNVHRTEEELRKRTEELEILRAKCAKMELERNAFKHENDKLEAKVSEMTADLAEEHSTATLASERLDAETAERCRLERELNDVQNRNRELTQQSERIEMELMYARADMNGGYSEEDDDGDGSVFKQKYERVARELEFTKRRLQQQHEDDLEQLVGLKKQLEKKLADAYEEVEEQRQIVAQWKRKVQKLTADMNDLRLLLEEQSARNNQLEKKQRKFDAETQLLTDELKNERQQKERLCREKDVMLAEKFVVESNLADVRLDLELKEERLNLLQQEYNDLTFGGKSEDEVTALRKQKQDLERRMADQEEELDDFAGQTQMLEQAKVRLEMSLEQQRKEARREAQQRDEELEEVRCNAQKKVKALEAQLENEHEERTLLLREKHALERRLATIAEAGRSERAGDEAQMQRLKKDLKRTKALLRDAQTQLERSKTDAQGKILIRQLRNQLEDAEYAHAAAIKAKQTVEAELTEVQSQLDDVTRAKLEAEQRAIQAHRERSDLRTQLEENEEELADVMKKYRATIQQLSSEQAALQEQYSIVADLEAERNTLKEQLAEMQIKLESIETLGGPTSNAQAKKLELRVKELESKLEFEQTTRSRMEVQIARLKEALDKLQSDLAHARGKEQQAQDNIRKLQKQLRETKEENISVGARENEAAQKRRELEKKVESLEAELAGSKADLRLALQRIDDLQAAIQGELDDQDDSHSHSESDNLSNCSSDESIETFLANHNAVYNSNSKVSNSSSSRRTSPSISSSEHKLQLDTSPRSSISVNSTKMESKMANNTSKESYA